MISLEFRIILILLTLAGAFYQPPPYVPGSSGFDNSFFVQDGFHLALILLWILNWQDSKTSGNWLKSAIAVGFVIMSFWIFAQPYYQELQQPQYMQARGIAVNAPIDLSDPFDAILICGITKLKHPNAPIESMYAPCYK